MTPELFWLAATMVLATSLWIPYIIGVNSTERVGVDPFQRPPGYDGLPDWVVRAHRAHANLLEQAMPFAVLIVLAHILGVSSVATTSAATAFFWLRVAHAVGMITGIAKMPTRPIIFTLGWVATLVIAAEILRLA